ncbi:hypothetical protein ACE1B6_16615 [Aerosakkonemataceae cyanobacterium BLCC-F154]|uniref:Uncharacterized protein n=1 Tax=Floridaenema fluviatile BLCC-F154 TaxID=3153640 RepID=A0ABV4YDG5_9CYAN
MNQHPFNNSEPQDPNNLSNLTNNPQSTSQEVEPTTTEGKDVKSAKKSVKRFTLKLVVVGVTLGVILAIGVITFLSRYNFFEAPAQIEEPSD